MTPVSGISSTSSGAGGGAMLSSKAGGLKMGTRNRWIGRGPWTPTVSTEGRGLCEPLARCAARRGEGRFSLVRFTLASVPMEEWGEVSVRMVKASGHPQVDW